MKRTPIRKISRKQERVNQQERVRAQELLAECKGLCMVCGEQPDWRGLMKEHHYTGERRQPMKFILVCGKCASGFHGIEEVEDV